MHGIFAVGLRCLPVLGLVASITLGVTPMTHAAAIDVSWTAPTTNADGTPLRDLAGYHLYVDTQAPSCPSTDFVDVSSPTPAPASGQRVSERVTGLDANTTYFARVTAVDQSGNESACSAVASGIARADFSVTPTTTVDFGRVATGATVDRTFTVVNTSPSTLSGSVSVGAPFRVVAGGSFSLAPNATQTVTVRFAPTAAGTFAGNVNVTAAGDTVSRGVTGSTTGGVSSSPSTSPPPSGGPLNVFITSPAPGETVSATEWVVLWVEGTSGSANAFTLSANGAVVGSVTTSARGPVTIPWTPTGNGSQTLTASVRDATGQTGAVSLQVNVAGAGGGGVSTPPPPPANDILIVSITQPDQGEIVAGTVSIVLWVDGTTGSSNDFTLSVDGGVIGNETTGARGPVVFTWDTTIENGSHTLTAMVRDAAGRTGRTSIDVVVRN
jgi:hypothetical protein